MAEIPDGSGGGGIDRVDIHVKARVDDSEVGRLEQRLRNLQTLSQSVGRTGAPSSAKTSTGISGIEELLETQREIKRVLGNLGKSIGTKGMRGEVEGKIPIKLRGPTDFNVIVQGLIPVRLGPGDFLVTGGGGIGGGGRRGGGAGGPSAGRGGGVASGGPAKGGAAMAAPTPQKPTPPAKPQAPTIPPSPTAHPVWMSAP